MTVLLRFAQDRARSTLWWSVGVVGLVLMTVGFYPSLKGQESFAELFEELPDAVKGLVGSIEGIPITSPAGYLQGRMYGSLLPLLLLIFGIGLGARAVGGSEDDGTLELLLSNPVTRLRVAVERYAAAVALVVVLGAVTVAAVLVLGPPFDILEGIALQKLLLANAAAVMLALVHLSLAYAVGCVTGRRAPAISIATAVAVSGYLLQGLAAVSDAADAVSVVSPWRWYLDRNLLASGPGPVAFVVPLLVSVALATAGVSRFLGRDLR